MNLGDQHKQPRLVDADREPVKLVIKPGETVTRPNVYYLGMVKVNSIGYWRKSLSKLMNKKRPLLEQMIALCLLAYVVGVWFGEVIRDVVYAQLDIAQLSETLLRKPSVDTKAHPKWLLYSGLLSCSNRNCVCPASKWRRSPKPLPALLPI